MLIFTLFSHIINEGRALYLTITFLGSYSLTPILLVQIKSLLTVNMHMNKDE
jgi:hypothetical protein